MVIAPTLPCVAVTLGVAAELAERRQRLGRALLRAAVWPFFAALGLGAAIAAVCER